MFSSTLAKNKGDLCIEVFESTIKLTNETKVDSLCLFLDQPGGRPRNFEYYSAELNRLLIERRSYAYLFSAKYLNQPKRGHTTEAIFKRSIYLHKFSKKHKNESKNAKKKLICFFNILMFSTKKSLIECKL